jgi:hypothetical protein
MVKDKSAMHILCDCEAIAYFRFHHLGQFFMEPSDYYDAPIKQSPTFCCKCRVYKGLIKKGKHNISLKVAVQGLDYYGPPLMHSFIQHATFISSEVLVTVYLLLYSTTSQNTVTS